MTEQPKETHQDSKTTDTIANTPEKVVVWKYMVQGWGQGDLALVDEIVAPDVIDHDPFPGQKAGREGWKQALLMIRGIMPDMKVAIEEMVQEGEHVAVRYVCLGTNQGEFQGRPPTGKPMLIRGIGIERVTNGKMSETHRILDIRFDYQPSSQDVASIWDLTHVEE